MANKLLINEENNKLKVCLNSNEQITNDYKMIRYKDIKFFVTNGKLIFEYNNDEELFNFFKEFYPSLLKELIKTNEEFKNKFGEYII
jgi:phosphodiesterase/alkaline phosphatase D-like protein